MTSQYSQVSKIYSKNPLRLPDSEVVSKKVDMLCIDRWYLALAHNLGLMSIFTINYFLH